MTQQNIQCQAGLHFRDYLCAEDLPFVQGIIVSSGFFSDGEIEVACRMAHARVNNPNECDYDYIAMLEGDRLIGFSAICHIGLTQGGYDILWIAVHDNLRGKGYGRRLLSETEERLRHIGARNAYLETSGRAQYMPTRSFYTKCGYTAEAILKDFYAPGDDKVVFSKCLTGHMP